MSESSASTVIMVLRYLLAYVVWILLSVVGFWLIFQVRGNLLDVLTLLLEDPDTFRDTWIVRAVDRWFIMVLGGVWVFCIALLEGYFRNGVDRGLLQKRIVRVITIIGAITLTSLVLSAIF